MDCYTRAASTNATHIYSRGSGLLLCWSGPPRPLPRRPQSNAVPGPVYCRRLVGCKSSRLAVLEIMVHKLQTHRVQKARPHRE